MTADELRALQAPLKAKYKVDPDAAVTIHRAEATLQPGTVTCTVGTRLGAIDAGLHQAAGGDGASACSADMLLEALVACAGVTLSAVATALSIPLRGGKIAAEGELDFRGTLGVGKDVPVGLSTIRLHITLDSDAAPEQLDKLVQMTERYCVILQTLKTPPVMIVRRA